MSSRLRSYPFPPPWNTGREASEINRPRENSARARLDRFWPGEALSICLSVCVCVCLWCQSDVPNLGARWENRRLRIYLLRKRVHHTNTSSMGSDSTTSLFFRDLGARWLTTRSEGHSNGWAKGEGPKRAKKGPSIKVE